MLDAYSKLENKLFNKIKREGTLKDFLEGMTKEELNKIRKNIGIKGISNLKKQEFIVELEAGILDNIDNIIKALDDEQKDILESLISNDGVHLYHEDNMESLIKYRYTGMVFSGILDNEDKVMIIPRDLVLPIKEKFLNSAYTVDAKEIQCNSLWINIIKGLLYYYGVLSLENAHRLAVNLCGEKIDFYDFITQAIDIENEFYKYDKEERIIYLKEVEKPFYIIHQQNKMENEYLPINMQMIEKVCNGQLTESEKEIYNLLVQKKSIDKEEAMIITKGFMTKIKNGVSLKEALEELFQFINFKNMDEANYFINSISIAYNTTNMWNLKGYTPYEIQKRSSNKGTTIVNKQKIGRNEPCPCGSGKKYKKCCGK